MPTYETKKFDVDRTEPSPSTGPQATAAALSVEYGLGRHEVTIVDGQEQRGFEINQRYLKDFLEVTS